MSKIISPAVKFTTSTAINPTDAIQQITSAFVGPTQKGRYFVPTFVNDFQDFVNKFGRITKNNYTAMAVRNYLSETSGATIVSVAGTEEFDVTVGNIQIDGKTVAQVLFSKAGEDNADIESFEVTGNADDFTLNLVDASAEAVETYENLSLDKEDRNRWIGRFTNPKSESIHFYVKYLIDPGDITEEDLSSVSIGIDVQFDVTFTGYQASESPVVVSQNFSGDYKDLFKFVTLQDNANRDVKISIEDIRTAEEVNPRNPEYGDFTVTVRGYDDTDRRQEVYEQFLNVNFNPQSQNYIRRAIGDKYESFNATDQRVEESGLYPNNSNFIRVEMIDEDDIPENAIPWGFNRYDHAGEFFDNTEPSPYYALPEDDTDGDKEYYGVDFDETPDYYIDSLHNVLPKVVNSGVDAERFILSNDADVTDFDKERAFNFGFYGGSDGFNPTILKNIGEDITSSNTFGFDLTDETSSGSISYQNAIRTLEDPEQIDINLLTLPGINSSQHGHLVNYATERMESRGDVFVIADAGGKTTDINTMITGVNTIDSYQIGTFAPWIWVQEPAFNQVMPVPPSVVIPAVFAFNDNVSRPWYAPFGLNRGVISQSIKPSTLYRLSERDTLYEGRINPIARILNEGTVVLGQKTLLANQDDPLNRINVVRLLIEAQKFISTVAWRVIGEPINEGTRTTLEDQINDYLEVVQEENGLEEFEVNFSEELNTPDVVNRNLIRGVIFMVPQKATEGIQIQFVVGDTGVEFDV